MRNSSAFGPDDRARECANTGETAMERRKFVIGLGALATGSAAAVGSGAFTAAQIDGRETDIAVVDDSNGLIGLEAGDSELVAEDDTSGELYIDFSGAGGDSGLDGEGVNPNSVYQVGGITEDEADDAIGFINDDGGDPFSQDDVLYTAESVSDKPAFSARNNTNSERTIEVTFNPDDDTLEHEDVSVYVVSSSGGFQFAADLLADGDEEAGRTAEDVGIGQALDMSLLVVTGDVDPTVDVEGELIITADEALEGDDP